MHLSGIDQNKALLKEYGIEVQDDVRIESERPLNSPRCNESIDKTSRFCWKGGMILDKTLSEKNSRKKAKVIEESVHNLDPVDGSAKLMVMGYCQNSMISSWKLSNFKYVATNIINLEICIDKS